MVAKEFTVILGNQLFPYKHYSKLEGPFFMCEDYGLCTHFKYHKHKIMHFLIAMREYADLLRSNHKKVHYIELDKRHTFTSSLKKFIKENSYTAVNIHEIEDKFFEKELFTLFDELKLTVNILESPMFLCPRYEFKNYLKNNKSPFMKTFYERERKRLGILMNKDGSPRGGKWSFDSENRKKVPKNAEVIDYTPRGNQSDHLNSIKELVKNYFSDHPGSEDNFWIPTNRTSALNYFNRYLEERFDSFGTYQDAIDTRSEFLHHSLISPLLNMGLLIPQEVIEKVEAKYVNEGAPLNSVEGFIRQVVGWREFIRGIYQNYSEEQEQKNFFKHKRKLKKCWYTAQTGIPIIDDAIKKALKWGYCHHIERLMILNNVMLMLEVDPKEVYKWFMEMFVDSSDWVMGPNVYGMGQFSDGGIVATKPYISGSNYLLKMSHYKKGEWCDALDGLYWQFIARKSDFLMQNHRMAMMVNLFEKMDSDKKERIFSAANEFRKQVTY